MLGFQADLNKICNSRSLHIICFRSVEWLMNTRREKEHSRTETHLRRTLRRHTAEIPQSCHLPANYQQSVWFQQPYTGRKLHPCWTAIPMGRYNVQILQICSSSNRLPRQYCTGVTCSLKFKQQLIHLDKNKYIQFSFVYVAKLIIAQTHASGEYYQFHCSD